ncbi:uncharacterized protein LOC109594027 isoform X2 [Aethina tumida]|nr:uncharacterized protein LOC109594027 isoform X2 [Aethina tumida]
MEVCGLNQDEDVSHIRLCSKHFKSSDYVDINAKSLGGRLSLKDGSIPSVKVPYPKPNIQSSSVTKNCNSITKAKEVEFIGFAEPISCLEEPYIIVVSDGQEKNVDQTILLENPLLITAPTTEKRDVEQIENHRIPVNDPEVTSHDINAKDPKNNNIIRKPQKKHNQNGFYISEFQSQVPVPKRANRILNMMRQRDVEKTKKIKQLQTQNRYLLKRVAILEKRLKRFNNQDQD